MIKFFTIYIRSLREGEAELNRFLIDDCCACRKVKRREASVLRAAHLTKRSSYSLRLDVRKYLESIDQSRLKKAFVEAL
jgi:hypothetical protein